MEAVGELDNEDANVVAGGNHEAEEVGFGLGKISVEIAHTGASGTKLGDAVNEAGDGFAKGGANILEGNIGIFDSVVKDAGDGGIFIHTPILENLHDGKRMDNVGVARFTKLAFVGLGRESNSLFLPCGIHDIIIA